MYQDILKSTESKQKIKKISEMDGFAETATLFVDIENLWIL